MSRVLILVFLLPCISIAQTRKIDSLLVAIGAAPDDTSRVNALLSAGDEYLYSNIDSAIYCYDEAKRLCEKSNYTKGTILYLLSRQYVMCIQGQFDSAMVLCTRARQLASQTNNKPREASAIGNIGSIYLYKGNKVKAIEHYLEALEIFETLGDKRRLAILYTNIAINYERLKQYESSLIYGGKAIELARQGPNEEALGLALNNQAVTLLSARRRAETLPLLEEALAIAKKLNAKRLLLTTLINLAGSLEDEIREKQEFKNYIDHAYRLSLELDEKVGLAISLRCLGSYYFYEGDLATARRYALDALDLTRKFDNPEEEVHALELLTDISASARDLTSHIQYRKLVAAVRDSLVNKDLIATVKELELKYDTDKKEARIAALSREKELQSYVLLEQSRLNAGLVGIVFVLVIIGAVLYRNYVQRQQLQQQTISNLQTERQLLATNAVLQGQEVERKRLAKDLHDGLGGMLSGAKFTFDAMRDHLIMTPDNQHAFSRGMDLLQTSIDELRRVAHNMMPESLVKTGLSQAVRDLCADYARDNLDIIFQEYGLDTVKLSNTVSITVYRIVQELMNNSMKHSGATQIIVQLSLHDRALQITVEDNGIGTTRDLLDKSSGMGWSNIRSRVDYLNGTIDVKGLAHTGTSITVTTPLDLP